MPIQRNNYRSYCTESIRSLLNQSELHETLMLMNFSAPPLMELKLYTMQLLPLPPPLHVTHDKVWVPFSVAQDELLTQYCPLVSHEAIIISIFLSLGESIIFTFQPFHPSPFSSSFFPQFLLFCLVLILFYIFTLSPLPWC